MSGTSLDGVDAVIVEFAGQSCQVLNTCALPYPSALRSELMALHMASDNELERTALISNQLSYLYAEAVQQLLSAAKLQPRDITAIGCHGQTLRHRPELGFTLQIGNPALLAELTEITVIADFRSRDIAAGGQGAPLVPAFHQGVFADPSINRVIVNIGGIANLTSLPIDGKIIGFDSGPGNMLMDSWIEKHLGKRYDEDGNWALSGILIHELFDKLIVHPYFDELPPKSTGRDIFNLAWLEGFLDPRYLPEDVQRTLLELSAASIALATHRYCGTIEEMYLCGGGAHNHALFQRLQQLLPDIKIQLSDELGIGINWVEATAFAWLAKQCFNQQPGNLPEVTGAKGLRILGAIYAC